eukprot:s2797_g7.t1
MLFMFHLHVTQIDVAETVDSAGAPESRARQDAGLLVASRQPTFLGKVLPQVEDEAFRSAMHAGVLGATVVKDLSEIPVMMEGYADRQARVHLQPKLQEEDANAL